MYSDKFNIEYEEMEAQGYLIYCECVKSFEPTKATFSTYLYINLLGRLSDYGTQYNKQRGISLHDYLNGNITDLENEISEDNCTILSYYDNEDTTESLLDYAKKSLSIDSFKVFSWILSRNWQKKGRTVPSIYAVVEAFNWTRTKATKCWNDCKNFWLNECACYY